MWLEAAPGPGGAGPGGAGLGSLERLNTALTLPNRPLEAGCEGDGLGPFGGWPSGKPLIFFPVGILSRVNYRLWGLYAFVCITRIYNTRKASVEWLDKVFVMDINEY